MLNPINLTPYPINNHQSVYTAEGNTTLELVGVIAKKMNEAIDVVNGVDVLATQARQIVQEMQQSQNTLVNEANDFINQMSTTQEDLKQALTLENTDFVNTLDTAKDTTISQLNTEFNTFKEDINNDLTDFVTQYNISLTNAQNAVELTRQNFENSMNTTLNTFTEDITADKNSFLSSATQQVSDNVATNINTLLTNGTLANLINTDLLGTINQKLDENAVIVSDVEPTTATTWYDIKGETNFDVTGDMIFVEI